MRGYRLKQIEQYILDNDTVSMEAISENFRVSINTVRRDIAELQKLGSIEKIYGGVRAKKSNPLIPFEERHMSHMEEKELIGRRAAELVEEGDIIYLDSGTTTLQVIAGLGDSKRVTIITNNLNALVEAVPYKNLNVITMTGQLDRKTNSFVGMSTLRELESYNIKKAFMAAAGLSLTSGATNSSLLEYEIKSRIVQRSEKAFLLIDASKFGFSSLTTYAQIPDFDAIITDQEPPKEYQEYFWKENIPIFLPQKDA